MMIKKSNFIFVISIIVFEVAAILLPAGFAVITAESGRNELPEHSVGMPQSPKTPVHLYFADSNNRYLISEARALVHSEDPLDFGRVIIKALIEGPKGRLGRTLPAETKLRALYITRTGVCYADLTPAVREIFPGGSQSELLAVYSIVNSLILNVPVIEKVKILIGGKESDTLAGHVDLIHPVTANMLLIR